MSIIKFGGSEKMSFMKYRGIISLAAAFVLILIVNFAVTSAMTKSPGSSAWPVTSGTDVSRSDTTTGSAVSLSDVTDAVSGTDATSATTQTQTTSTTAAPIKIRFAKGFRYSIVVYLKSQSVAVYTSKDKGKTVKQVKCFTCSSGIEASPTPTGDFSIIGKHRWRSLQGNVFGQYCSRIHGHILFHSTPYLKEKPSSLDDAEYDKLGTAVSHGCIRMSVGDCKWIYDNAPLGTPVSIVEEEGPTGATPVSRNPGKKYSGWDPTDKWSKGNPYFKDTSSTSKKKTTASKAADTTSESPSATATTEKQD